MSGYPDCETYKALYKKYYDGRKPEELIELAGDIKNKVVLDLCAGDGRLSLDALLYGAKRVVLIEQERQMIGKITSEVALKNPDSLGIYIGRLQNIDVTRTSFRCDVVFCQQGVNYWLDGFTAEMVANVLSSGGVFIFNTFNKKPPEKPAVKEYELEGLKFVETTWSIKSYIQHVQVREGLDPHTTDFWWISPDDFQRILSPYFNIQHIIDGRTSIYRCSRK